MNNALVLFGEIVVVFSLLLLSYRVFGRVGAMAWVGIATVIANIITAKNAEIFGLSTAIGSVMFASTFLATDVLTEYHGKEYAKTAVYIGLFSDAILIISSQIALLYSPSAIDYADGAMRTLFSLNLRISAASMVMYFIANIADVFLYSKLKEKGGALWFRNNACTILCNCLENFGFIGLAFGGIYNFKTVLTISASVSIIESLVAICDTPFLYIAGRIKKGEGSNGSDATRASE